MKDLEAFVQTNNRLPRHHVPGEDSLAKRFARLLTKRDQKEGGLSADILRRIRKLTELQLESAESSVGDNAEIDALLCDFKGGASFANKFKEVVVFARAHGQRLPMRDGKFPKENTLAQRLKGWERERLNLGAAYSKDRAALLDLLHKACPPQDTPHFEKV